MKTEIKLSKEYITQDSEHTQELLDNIEWLIIKKTKSSIYLNLGEINNIDNEPKYYLLDSRQKQKNLNEVIGTILKNENASKYKIIVCYINNGKLIKEYDYFLYNHSRIVNQHSAKERRLIRFKMMYANDWSKEDIMSSLRITYRTYIRYVNEVENI